MTIIRFYPFIFIMLISWGAVCPVKGEEQKVAKVPSFRILRTDWPDIFPLSAGKTGPKESSVLQKEGILPKPEMMMHDWLLSQIDEAKKDWQARYESIKTLEDIRVYQNERIDYFWEQLGPLWEKSPLNAQVVGTIEKEGFRVEKVVFESVPGFFVTGALFLPTNPAFKPPYHAVLIACGHTDIGKGAQWMQRICGLGATNGLAMFIIDPIEQGDRWEILKEDGNYYAASVPAHNIVGAGSILLGRNTATFEVWDMVRSLDYLQSRTDINPNKLGVAGISGGGTQTSYLMALDERITAAAPSCFICNMYDTLTHVNGPQDAEQNIFGQLGFGMDHPDYCIMRAPQATLLCTATEDFFNINDSWTSYRYANRIYTRLGLPERMAILERDDKHNYSQEHREGTIRWMLRWLAQRDEPIFESESMPDVSLEEIRCVAAPGIMTLPGARTTFDLNRELAKELRTKREQNWKAMTPDQASALVRDVAGIRPLAELPDAKIRSIENDSEQTILETEPGIFLLLRANIPQGSQEITLSVDDQGTTSEKAGIMFADKSKSVASVDLRGWGETQAKGRDYYRYGWFGTDGSDYYLAYLLGSSYIGMRTEDLLVTAKYLRDTYGVKINLVADGYARSVALHAAVAEPGLFKTVTIANENSLTTWDSLIEQSPCPIQLTDTIHGVLHHYDLDNLLHLVP